MSSPVEHLYQSLVLGVSDRNFFHPFITEEHKKRLLRGVFESYYFDIEAGGVIFDTNRNWSGNADGLAKIFPDAKIICCVRDIVSILNSFEHLFKKNPGETPKIKGFVPHMNIHERTECLMSASGTIGGALSALRKGYYGKERDRLLIVNYDDLVAHPEKALSTIYKFIGEPYFHHDFENLSYEEKEFDAYVGLPGMHTVRKKVSFGTKHSELILPKDIVERYERVELF